MSPVTTTVDEVPALTFVRPIPGFADRVRFALVRLDDAGVLCALQSLDDPELRFLVVPPESFFPGYAPEVADDVVADLAVTSPEDLLALVIVNAGETLAETTANLLAPVVVNTANRTACQVILSDERLSVRASLVA